MSMDNRAPGSCLPGNARSRHDPMGWIGHPSLGAGPENVRCHLRPVPADGPLELLKVLMHGFAKLFHSSSDRRSTG